MDTNVQVALVSVFATSITTLGVIVTALISSRSKDKVTVSLPHEDDDPDWDMKDVVQHLISLVAENQRKEDTIAQLRKELRKCRAELESKK